MKWGGCVLEQKEALQVEFVDAMNFGKAAASTGLSRLGRVPGLLW